MDLSLTPIRRPLMKGNRFISRGKICVLIGFADVSEVEQMTFMVI